MHSRRKRARRLAILCACVCLLIASLAGLYWLSVQHKKAALAQLRQQGMIAFGDRDYERSIGFLGQYLADNTARDKDPDALYAYGLARVNVPMPQNQNVYEGISIFERYLTCGSLNDAQRQEGRRLLLNFYVQGWHNREAIELADRLLASNPRDAFALEQKVLALDATHDDEKALKASEALNDLAPENLPAQRETLRLMRRLHETDAALLERAAELRKRHPNDPRFEMLSAYACQMTGADKQALQWLRAAAGHTPSDPDLVTQLAGDLDQVGLFAVADSTIRQAAQRNNSPAMKRLLILRLWQDGDLAQVLDQTNSFANQQKGDPDLAGLRALALFDAGKKEEAQRLADALAQAGHDSITEAWAEALHADFAGQPVKPLELVTALQHAVARNDSNPVLHEMLAEAYTNMGEGELGLAELRKIIVMAPAWAGPHALATRILVDSGRYNYGLDASLAALDRAPGRRDLETAHALALYHFAVDTGRTAEFQPLIRQMTAMQEQWRSFETLSARVDLLMRTGQRDAAIKAARAAMGQSPPADAGVLLQLASTCDEYNLGLGGALRDAAAAAYGPRPDIALAQAMALHRAGDTAKGLQLLVDAKKAHPADKGWRLALARYRETTKDPSALSEWESLGADFPQDIAVQSAITYAPSRTRDREFWQQTIDRLKASTGEQGVEWRAERGRWLLAGKLSQQESDEAVRLLSQVVEIAPTLPEPHRLLAMALENNHDLVHATAEWTIAHRSRPRDPVYLVGLIGALFESDRQQEAVTYLDELSKLPSIDLPTRVWAARQYAAAGRVNNAILLLRAEKPDAQRDALLADLERRAGAEQPARSKS